MKLFNSTGPYHAKDQLLPTTAWDHNNHYHQFLLNQLPTSVDYTLDIGCGHGDFAVRLAQRAGHVDGIDLNHDALHEARLRYSALTNLHLIEGDFLEHNQPLACYDVITSLAAVHHMEFRAVLRKIEQLLRPGGILVILGLYRATTITDYAMDVIGVGVNFVYQNFMYRSRQNNSDKAVPLREPSETLAEIRRIASEVMPSSQIRRHVLWRYSLVWQKPV